MTLHSCTGVNNARPNPCPEHAQAGAARATFDRLPSKQTRGGPAGSRCLPVDRRGPVEPIALPAFTERNNRWSTTRRETAKGGRLSLGDLFVFASPLFDAANVCFPAARWNDRSARPLRVRPDHRSFSPL
jgi:hypothetical protein